MNAALPTVDVTSQICQKLGKNVVHNNCCLSCPYMATSYLYTLLLKRNYHQPSDFVGDCCCGNTALAME